MTLYLFLVFTALLGLLSYKPLTVNTNNSWVESLLNVNGTQLKLRKLKVWFDGNLNIQGEDGEVVSKDNSKVLNISKVNMSFSNAAFLLGKIAPKRIRLEGLTLDIHHEIEGTYIAGFPLTSSSKKNAKGGMQNAKPLSFIEYLNQESAASAYFKNFESLSATHINLNIYDNVNLKNWVVTDAQVNFDRSFLKGEELVIEGKFSRPGFLSVTPAKLTLTHPKFAQKANMQVAMKNVSSDLFDDYFPFENPVHARGDVILNLDILENNSFEDIHVKMAMSEGSIHVTPAYNFPFLIQGGNLDVRYNYLKDILSIDKLDFVDKTGWPLKINGTITDVTSFKDMAFDLKLDSLGNTTVSHVSSYLPDKRIRGAVNWIRNHVHGSVVKNLKLAYYGKPSELPSCDKRCGFDGSFDFEDLSLSFLKHTDAAEGLNGHFKMKDDYIKITSKSGTVEGHTLKGLHTVIAGHFSKEIESGITVTGEISGPVQKLLNVIDKETGDAEWGFTFTGQHVSKGSVFIPFKKPSLSNVVYNFKSDVQNVQTNTLVKDLNIQVPKGEVAFTNEKLLMTGEGTVNNLPVEFEWHENMLKPIQETVVSVWGELPPAMAMKHVERVGLEISDTVSSSFNLKAVGAGQYDFEYMTDLTKNQLTQNDLHWRKGVGQKLDLQASGRLGKGVEVITVDVSATGENNIRLLGAFDMSEKIKADFKTFNIAGHKLKAAIYGEKVNLVGEQLDISSMDILDQTEVLGDVSSSLNSDITINVDKMILKKGQVEKVTGDLKLKGGKWQYIDFKGQNENDGFHFSLKKPSSDHNAIRFTANSVGEVLKEAGLLNTFKKGVLKANADIYTVEGQKEGRGLIKIDKTYMVKAPILAKLLSLISLEELLSSKDGIYFDDVEIPLLFVGDEIITDHAYLSGPSIGLRLRGKINTTKKTVNLEGQLIPAEGLNSFIAKIPLLGDLLTGSQSGLLVADFKVKGSIKDPKVTANPLSFVMPGLVKDFFGTLFNRGDITRPEKGK